MIKAVKEIFFNLIKKQNGVALPVVLAMFAIGSFLIVPSINYMATNLKAGLITKAEFKGILAADAGVEDALWKIKNEDTDFLEPYTITDINGMSVDIDIDEVDIIAGETVNSGDKDEDLVVGANVTYNEGIYSYVLSVFYAGTGLVNIVQILIDFPPGVDYVLDSTSTNITLPENSEPTVSGSPTTGITLVWVNGSQPKIGSGETKYHCFELSGPAGIEGVEGHGFVSAQRQDVGDVWIGDVTPYSITAQAKDDSEAVVATIRAGVWSGSGMLDISCWQVTF